MSSTSRHESQLFTGPTLLPNGERQPSLLPISEQGASSLPNQEQGLGGLDPRTYSANVLDEALMRAGVSTPQVAEDLAIGESMVRKMRSPNNREGLSFEQFLILVSRHPRFYIEVNIAIDNRTGILRRAAMFLQQQAAAFLSMAVAR